MKCPKCGSKNLIYIETPVCDIWFPYNKKTGKVKIMEPAWEIQETGWECQDCGNSWEGEVDLNGVPITEGDDDR
jgi:predicted nucleic-acid-binding Zn-ribbon protein